MEAGHRAAGYGDEQDREQVAQLLILETSVNRQVHVRMRCQKSGYRAKNHAHEHEGSHIVTGLLHQPHGQYGRQENISEGHIQPCALAGYQRQVHAESQGSEGEQKS